MLKNIAFLFSMIFLVTLPVTATADEPVDLNARHLIIIMDKSASMLKSDPEKFRMEGAQLAIALAKRSDHISIISFSDGAEVNSYHEKIKSNARKDILQKKVYSQPNGNRTNFRDPLNKALDIIERVKKPGVVVFLTDGDHNVGPAGAVKSLIKKISDANWKIFTINLQQKDTRESELIKVMGPATGGTNFNVSRPEDLIYNYLTISQDIQNVMMTETNDFAALKIFPVIRRVVIIEISNKEKILKGANVRIGGISQELSKDDATYVYRYPYEKAKDRPSRLNIISVERPLPGRWDIQFEAGIKRALILIEPSFEFVLPKEKPRRVYYDGEEIEFEISLQSLAGNMPQELVKQLEIKALVFKGEEQQKPIAEIPLKYNPNSSTLKNLVFEALTDQFRLSDPQKSESYRVAINIDLNDETNPQIIWHHKKNTSFSIMPWKGKITATPKNYNNESAFRLKEEFKLRLLLESTATSEPVPVKLTNTVLDNIAGATIKIEPEVFSLIPGQQQEVTVSIENPRYGLVSGRIAVQTLIDQGIRGFASTYKIEFKKPELKFDKTIIDFGEIIAGESGSAELSVSTNMPEKQLAITSKLTKLANADINLSWDFDIVKQSRPSKARLSIIVPPNAKPGIYEGTISISSDIGTYTLKTKITVVALTRHVSRTILSFKAKAGLSSKNSETFIITTNTINPLPLKIEATDLFCLGKCTPKKLINISAPEKVDKFNPAEVKVSIGQLGLTGDGTYRGTIVCTVGSLRPFQIEIQIEIEPYQIIFLQKEIDFGKITIGQTAHKKIDVRSTAPRPVTIKIISGTLMSGRNKIPLSSQKPISVSAEADGTIALSYTPDAPGEYTGTLVCHDAEKGRIYEIPLRLEALSPLITYTPSSVVFKPIQGIDTDPVEVLIMSNSITPNKLSGAVFSAPPPGLRAEQGRLCTKDGVHKLDNIELTSVNFVAQQDSPGKFLLSIKALSPTSSPGMYQGVLRITPKYGAVILIPIHANVPSLSVSPSKQMLEFGRNIVIGNRVSNTVEFKTNAKVDVPVRIIGAYLKKIVEKPKESSPIQINDIKGLLNIRHTKPQSLTLTVDTAKLEIGNYSGEVIWSAMDTNQPTIKLFLSVAPPSFSIEPWKINFGSFTISDRAHSKAFNVENNSVFKPEYKMQIEISGENENGESIPKKHLPYIFFKSPTLTKEGAVLFKPGLHEVHMTMPENALNGTYTGRIVFTPTVSAHGLPPLELIVQGSFSGRSWWNDNWFWITPLAFIALVILLILLLRRQDKNRRN